MFSAILTADGRRAFAFAAIIIGCGIFTAFAAFGVWMLRGHAQYTFWLALAAHAQLGIGFTGLCALLVRRTVKVTRDGVEITDGEAPVAEVVTRTTVNAPQAPEGKQP